MAKDGYFPETREHEQIFIEKHDRFFVEKDLSNDEDEFSCESKSIQVRLENSCGEIFISLQNGRISTLKNFNISFDRFYEVLSALKK